MPAPSPLPPDPTSAASPDNPNLVDVSDAALYSTHIVEVTRKDGRVETIGARIGGVAGGLTAEQLADHLNLTNHFRGDAKKIIVRRGGTAALAGNLANIIRNPKAARAAVATPPAHVKAEVEPHPDPEKAAEPAPAPSTAGVVKKVGGVPQPPQSDK